MTAIGEQLLRELMTAAIDVCKRGIAAGESPFGAVVATSAGAVVCAAHNTVRASNDPTAHAEINAVRGACRTIGAIRLSGCLMATTCEPCPMCASAIHWAGIDAVVFGASIQDAADAGFNELNLPCASLYEFGSSTVRVHAGVLAAECTQLFQMWKNGPNPRPY